MQTILITGASSGIGLACAKKLAQGNRLILCSRNTQALETLRTMLSGAADVHIFSIDVTNEEQVFGMFGELESKEISPEIVVNSAGLALGLEFLEEGSISDWDLMIDTNIKGLLMVCKSALRNMKEKNRGHIINIGSIAGTVTYAKGVVYAATKAAVKSISDGLRKEVVQYEIKITNIQPGLVETNFSNVRFHGDVRKAKKVYEGIRPLSAEDIATIISFVINTPTHVQINEITVTPVHQATVEVMYRNL